MWIYNIKLNIKFYKYLRFLLEMELSIEQVLLLFVGYFYDRRKAIFQLAGGENAYVICLPSKATLISSCGLLWNTLLQDRNSCFKKKKVLLVCQNPILCLSAAM